MGTEVLITQVQGHAMRHHSSCTAEWRRRGDELWVLRTGKERLVSTAMELSNPHQTPTKPTSFLNTSLLFLASSLEVSASAVLGFFEA